MPEQHFDYVVIGSGFGGSVAALRLAEKGYNVGVIEQGRRLRPKDFPKTNLNLKKFLFFPKLGMHGILRLDYFRGLLVLSGAGVGGGSLVYANTLLEPTKQAFKSWPKIAGIDWYNELQSYYQTAKKMLGATRSPVDYETDHIIRAASHEITGSDSFEKVDVGVYFGDTETSVPDPYFNGLGPSRRGCNHCGGCMIGCRYDGKNTLDKNYLYLAEAKGVQIFDSLQVTSLAPSHQGYRVIAKNAGLLPTNHQTFVSAKVIVAAGVLGTLKLLFRCRDDLKTLPKISPTLGHEVRTNSETLLGARSLRNDVDYSKGLAISASVKLDANTKAETVRYPKGSDLFGLMVFPLFEGHTVIEKSIAFVKYLTCHPVKMFRMLNPLGFARTTVILLVMQTLDNSLRMVWRRSLFLAGRKRLTTKRSGNPPPANIERAETLAEKVADRIDGKPGTAWVEKLGISFTAHILGGCPIGDSPDSSVIDSNHRLHNYPDVYVLAGATVPANLGVNPSLTITAMAERAMMKIPTKNKHTN